MAEHPTETSASIPIQALLDGKDRFLTFLEHRVGSRETAQDILQRAYLTGLEREQTLRDPERVVAWFYRLLRNAVVDHYRHVGAERRALERFGFEQASRDRVELKPERQICACITDLLPAVRAEYADLIREIELEGQEIATVASQRKITAHNARVRLHRARRALRKALLETCGVCTDPSLDCSCQGAGQMGQEPHVQSPPSDGDKLRSTECNE